MDNYNDISATGAYLLAVLVAVAILADVRHDLTRLVSGRNVVLLAIGAWYLFEMVMLPAALRSHTQEEFNLGVCYVGLAFLSFMLGYHYTSGCSLFLAMGKRISFFDDERWLWRIVLVGALIGFAPIVYNTGTRVAEMFQGMMGQRATWGGLLGRGRYGDARAAFLVLELFVGAVAPFAAIILFDQRSKLVQRLFCFLVVVWPVLRGFGSGMRSSLIVAVGCSIAAVLYWRASAVWRKGMIWAILFSTPLLYGIMAAIVASRGSGAFSWEARERAEGVGNEMFRELLFIISKVPSCADYQYGYVYYVQLVNPIPRFLWPDKPTLDAGLLMADLYGEVNARGEAHLTISPGLIGEMYLNFGVFGIMGLSFFGGWLVKGWDVIPKLFSDSLPVMMFYSGGLGALFIMGRSFTMNMFYGLLGLVLLAWLIRSFNPNAVSASVHPAASVQ